MSSIDFSSVRLMSYYSVCCSLLFPVLGNWLFIKRYQKEEVIASQKRMVKTLQENSFTCLPSSQCNIPAESFLLRYGNLLCIHVQCSLLFGGLNINIIYVMLRYIMLLCYFTLCYIICHLLTEIYMC